jgi:triacylglycerol lipase
MQADYPPPSDKLTHIIGREVLAHAAALVSYPFGFKRRQKQTARQKELRTVVLIHGYLGNASSFLPLKGYLRILGIKNVLSFNYSASTSIETAASELRDFLRHHVRGGKIDLVCHSMGGLIARVYIKLLGGERRVQRCITLGTPNRGTYAAYWLPKAIGRSMRPDSQLLNRLTSADGGVSKVRYTNLVAGADHLIIPRMNAVASEDVIYMENIGHLGILYSPPMFRTVATRLLN